jgi:hypothetical protein
VGEAIQGQMFTYFNNAAIADATKQSMVNSIFAILAVPGFNRANIPQFVTLIQGSTYDLSDSHLVRDYVINEWNNYLTVVPNFANSLKNYAREKQSNEAWDVWDKFRSIGLLARNAVRELVIQALGLMTTAADIFRQFGNLVLNTVKASFSTTQFQSIYNWLTLYPLQLVNNFGIIVARLAVTRGTRGEVSIRSSLEPYTSMMLATESSVQNFDTSVFHHEMGHVIADIAWGSQYLMDKRDDRALLFANSAPWASAANPGDRFSAYSNTNYAENNAEIHTLYRMDTLALFNDAFDRFANNTQRWRTLRSVLYIMELYAQFGNLPVYSDNGNTVAYTSVERNINGSITALLLNDMRYEFTYLDGSDSEGNIYTDYALLQLRMCSAAFVACPV